MLHLSIREEVLVMYGDKKVARAGFLRRSKKMVWTPFTLKYTLIKSTIEKETS